MKGSARRSTLAESSLVLRSLLSRRWLKRRSQKDKRSLALLARRIASDSALLKITSAEQNPHDVDLQRAGLVELAEVATSNPSFVVIKAWEDLQATLRELAKVAFPGARCCRIHGGCCRIWSSKGYVDETFARAVRDFKGLRDDVAHGKHNPTAGEAVTYLESTRELAFDCQE